MKRPHWALLLLPLIAPPTAAAPIGTWSVLASSASGDWNGDVDTDHQSTTLRYGWGRDIRLRAEIDYLRIDTAGSLVARTPFGLVATGPGPKGSAAGAGGDGSGNGGSGPGPGAPPGAGSSPTVSPQAVTEPQPIARSTHSGLGDLRLTAARTLAGGGNKLFRLDAELGVKLPTADEDDYLGTGEADYRLAALGEYRLWTGTFFGGIGWNRLGDPAWADLADVFDVHAGFETDPLASGLKLSGWLEANQEVLQGAGDRTAVGFGARGSGRLAWRAEIQAGLGGAAEDLSLGFGVSMRGTAEPGRRGRL